MPPQHEMFEPPKLSLTLPAGLEGPRLWLRRLAIWEAPGGQKIRDIKLRPGLNVVWSPDGFDDATAGGVRAIGHGSGKTLFCRLLRYCLGEQRFADETQRESIALALPNGVVGAEVMLDGVCWAVVRPLGMRRRHVAIADGNLDEIAAGDGATTSIDPLIEAIEQTIVTPESRPWLASSPTKKLGRSRSPGLPAIRNAASTTSLTGVPRHPALMRRFQRVDAKPALGVKRFGHSLWRSPRRNSKLDAQRKRCEPKSPQQSGKRRTSIGIATDAKND